jgi:hypothetical protein
VFGTASPAKHQSLRDLGAVSLDYGNTQWIAALQTR